MTAPYCTDITTDADLKKEAPYCTDISKTESVYLIMSVNDLYDLKHIAQLVENEDKCVEFKQKIGSELENGELKIREFLDGVSGLVEEMIQSQSQKESSSKGNNYFQGTIAKHFQARSHFDHHDMYLKAQKEIGIEMKILNLFFEPMSEYLSTLEDGEDFVLSILEKIDESSSKRCQKEPKLSIEAKANVYRTHMFVRFCIELLSLHIKKSSSEALEQFLEILDEKDMHWLVILLSIRFSNQFLHCILKIQISNNSSNSSWIEIISIIARQSLTTFKEEILTFSITDRLRLTESFPANISINDIIETDYWKECTSSEVALSGLSFAEGEKILSHLPKKVLQEMKSLLLTDFMKKGSRSQKILHNLYLSEFATLIELDPDLFILTGLISEIAMVKVSTYSFMTNLDIFLSLFPIYDRHHPQFIDMLVSDLLCKVKDAYSHQDIESLKLILGNLSKVFLSLDDLIKLSLFQKVIPYWYRFYPLFFISEGLRQPTLDLFYQFMEIGDIENVEAIFLEKLSHALLISYFFVLEPIEIQKQWKMYCPSKDESSLLFWKYSGFSPMISGDIMHILLQLWKIPGIFDSSANLFLDLLASILVDSRIHPKRCHSSEVFKQLNFPLLEYDDFLSLINSYFPHDYEKISNFSILRTKQGKEWLRNKSKVTTEEDSLFFQLQTSLIDSHDNSVNVNRHLATEDEIIKGREIAKHNVNQLLFLLERACEVDSNNHRILMNQIQRIFDGRSVPSRDDYIKIIPVRPTFDYDIFVKKVFQRYPIFFCIFHNAVRHDHALLDPFATPLFSLFLNEIGEWNNSNLLEQNLKNRSALEKSTNLLLNLFSDAQWLPSPLSYFTEIIAFLQPRDICEILVKIWNYITHPARQELEINTLKEFIRKMMLKYKDPEVARRYGRFSS